jgi:hypothetical protein
MGEYHQGIYVPRNPSKYVGDLSKIYYRSGWERKCMIFFDTNPSILQWSSEETVIPYISPVDGRMHRYFVDFTVKYKTRTGQVKKAIVEVKPEAQTKPPTQKKKTKRFIQEVMTYSVNTAKWKFASEWAADRGFEFKILTEKDIGV